MTKYVVKLKDNRTGHISTYTINMLFRGTLPQSSLFNEMELEFGFAMENWQCENKYYEDDSDIIFVKNFKYNWNRFAKKFCGFDAGYILCIECVDCEVVENG